MAKRKYPRVMMGAPSKPDKMLDCETEFFADFYHR
jgi:hypothetical protein